MKTRLLHLFLCSLLALSAYAHREDYFRFTMGDNPTTDGWTVSGGTGESADGMFGVIADGKGPVVWTRDLASQAGEKQQPYVSTAVLKYITGTEDGGVAHTVPKVILESYSGDQISFNFDVAPDDQSKVIKANSTSMTGKPFADDVRYIKVVFENPKADEYVSCAFIDLTSDWFMPKTVTGDTIYIQAEDYDESWINGHKAYSPMSGPNKYREDDQDVYVDWQDDGAFFQSWVYGNKHKDDWYGRAVKNMCPNGGTWSEYKGEYKDATSNIVTQQNAKNNFGTWLEYTFDVPENCKADISLKAGSHWGAYAGVSGGTPKYGAARADGGFVVEGIAGDWVKRYVCGAVLSLDGNDLQTNWSSHPVNSGYTEAEYVDVLKNPSMGWTNNQILKDGIMVNSDTLYIVPNPTSMDCWSTYYKGDLFNKIMTDSKDESLAPFVKPDYKDVVLTAGRHTIKVQSLAAMWHFDEIRIIAKQGGGVDNSLADKAQNQLVVYPTAVTNTLNIKGDEVNYLIIDLRSGVVLDKGFGNQVDVSGLSTGIYAIKVGTNVARFIKK